MRGVESGTDNAAPLLFVIFSPSPPPHPSLSLTPAPQVVTLVLAAVMLYGTAIPGPRRDWLHPPTERVCRWATSARGFWLSLLPLRAPLLCLPPLLSLSCPLCGGCDAAL